MPDLNEETAPKANQAQNSRINASLSCGVAILFSLGTSISICLVTGRLWDYYMIDLFRHGLDAGVGLIFLTFIEFPLIFFSALIIWRAVGYKSRSVIRSAAVWLVSLAMGLGSSYITLLTASNHWRTESYEAFVNTQGLILLGYPSFALGVYAIALGIFRLRR